MACKNNKRNKKRAAFYGINKFDYEMRKKLTEGQLPPKEIYIDKKAKLIEYRSNYQWTKVWTSIITIVQNYSQKV